MAKFKTDFKDEIVDKRTRQIIDATGAIIHNNVLIKNTYTPKQAGDKVGATWFNDVGKRFNEIEDGTAKVKKAAIADNATNASHATSADSTPLAGRAYTSDNATMAETAKYAWVSDKVKTFDRNNVWHDDRLFYVHEIADGVYQSYIQEPNRVSKVKVDYAAWADCVQGFYPYHIIGVFNPAGNDYVVVPCGGHDIQYASVINGNWEAANIRVTSVARQFSNLLIFFDRFYTGNVQLNIRGFYPSV